MFIAIIIIIIIITFILRVVYIPTNNKLSYIHCMELSPTPEVALDAADALAAVRVPGSGWFYMPSLTPN